MRPVNAIIVSVFCLLSSDLFSQSLPVISGTMGVYGDFYKMNSENGYPVAPRRPSVLTRFLFNPTFTIKDFSLPFNIMVAPQNPGIITPSLPFIHIGDFLMNPINQVGFAPKYKWAQLLLGTQIPHYSELTFGDQPVFGGGIRLTPGKFLFEAFGGTSQHSIEQDTARRIKGAYARRLFAGRIGYGKEESSHLYLIGGYAIDDTNSLKIKPVGLQPQNGLLVSLDYKIKIGKQFYIKGETAGSLFSKDIRTNTVEGSKPAIPKEIFRTTESSRLDMADILTIGKEGKVFGFNAIGKYYGDGYVPLGYPFMLTDRLEVTVEPRFSLFKSMLNLSGSVGQRINNLTHARGATSTQTIGYLNISAQITEGFNISGNFSNFGFRNTMRNDSFRIEMVTLSYSVSPSYTFSAGQTVHSFMIAYNHDQFRDYNIVSGALNNNDANVETFIYSLALKKNPFTFSLMFNELDNALLHGVLTINSANITLGYGFFKNKINLTAGENISQTSIDSSAPSVALLTLVGIRYKIQKNLNFSVTGSINTYRSPGNISPYGYREDFLRTSLIYKF